MLESRPNLSSTVRIIIWCRKHGQFQRSLFIEITWGNWEQFPHSEFLLEMKPLPDDGCDKMWNLKDDVFSDWKPNWFPHCPAIQWGSEPVKLRRVWRRSPLGRSEHPSVLCCNVHRSEKGPFSTTVGVTNNSFLVFLCSYELITGVEWGT